MVAAFLYISQIVRKNTRGREHEKMCLTTTPRRKTRGKSKPEK